MINTCELKQAVYDIKDEIIEWRRDFHRFPEVGFEEVRTSQKVEKLLKEWGLEVKTGIAKTAVIGILKGEKPGKTIALRADMDALAVTEQNDIEYKSQIKGKMHACGHDGHTAMLLGAAKVLSGFKDKIQGIIKFVFQPAEEGPGIGGAKPITDTGILDDVDAIFGFHLNPLIPTGMVGINMKSAFASSDVFEMTIIGNGGHAGLPHKSVDAITISTRVIDSIQHIVSRELDPLEPAVISVGSIHGGSEPNVIAGEVEITGTYRTYSKEMRDMIPAKIENILKCITGMCGGDYKFNIVPGVPPVVNSDGLSEFVKEICSKELGPENVVILDKPTMGAEDFAYYLEKLSGAFFWLGCGNEEKGINKPMHHPEYNMDEDALPIGALLHALLAVDYLEK